MCGFRDYSETRVARRCAVLGVLVVLELLGSLKKVRETRADNGGIKKEKSNFLGCFFYFFRGHIGPIVYLKQVFISSIQPLRIWPSLDNVSLKD